MTELICIGCPKGCHLKVDEENDYAVTGFSCPIGEKYGRTELLHPTRVLTSTVKIEGGLYSRCPVKTNQPIPKKDLFAVMRLLNQVQLHAPVSIGDVVLSNVLESGADVVVTKEMGAEMHG